MRIKTLLGSVALGIAGLALAAPMASATSTGTIGLDKEVVHQGDSVFVFGTCDARGVTSVQLKSEDNVLAPVTLYRKEDGNGGKQLSGHTKVKADAHRGSWSVWFDCGGTQVRTLLVVQEQAKPKTSPAKPSPKPTATKAKDAGQVKVKPKGAADTGEGDVTTAAPVQEQGSNTGLFVLGGAGVLAAGGAGAFMLRRRSRA